MKCKILFRYNILIIKTRGISRLPNEGGILPAESWQRLSYRSNIFQLHGKIKGRDWNGSRRLHGLPQGQGLRLRRKGKTLRKKINRLRK